MTEIHYAYREVDPHLVRRSPVPLQTIQDDVVAELVKGRVLEGQPLMIEVRWETRPRTQIHIAVWEPIDRVMVVDLPPTYEARCVVTGREVSLEERAEWT